MRWIGEEWLNGCSFQERSVEKGGWVGSGTGESYDMNKITNVNTERV